MYLWVQKETKRTGAKLRTIPEAILDCGAHITIVEDRGPITKLLPALESGFETIITADDDHIYGKGWARGLVGWNARFPDRALCYRGRIFDSSRSYNSSKVITRVHRPVEFITSVSGVIYNRSFFSDSILKEWEQWPMNDDIVVSAHLKRRRISMEVVPFPEECTVKATASAHIDALSKYNVHRNWNDEGLQKLFWNEGS